MAQRLGDVWSGPLVTGRGFWTAPRTGEQNGPVDNPVGHEQEGRRAAASAKVLLRHVHAPYAGKAVYIHDARTHHRATQSTACGGAKLTTLVHGGFKPITLDANLGGAFCPMKPCRAAS